MPPKRRLANVSVQATYLAYRAARKTLQTFGLLKVIRGSLSPLIGRFACRLSSRSGEPQLIHGDRMYLAPPGCYPPLALLADRYEGQTTRLFQALLKPGMRVIDVGAHVGYYTLLAARLVGSEGKVYAFEPEPRNYELLVKNVQLNDYRNVVMHTEALSDRLGEAELFLSALDTARHSIFRNEVTKGRRIPVRTVTVDAFVEQEGWPQIDLLKIDVEGGETRVLAGMAGLVARKKLSNLVIELAPRELEAAGVSPSVLLEKLRSFAFRIHVVMPEGPVALERIEVDGLVKRLRKEGHFVNLFCVPVSAS